MALDVQGLAPLLQVYDMPKSVHFYRDLLGFELITTSEPGEYFDWAMLRLNDTTLMLNTQYERDQRPAVRDQTSAAGHADICLYFGCPDVDGAYKELRAKGLDVKEPVIQSYGMKQVYTADPDGYKLCFQWSA